MTEPLLLDVATGAAWRSWLDRHHATEPEVWLVFWKTHTGHPSIPFDEALDEALCFGWIDNLIRSLDGDRYLRRFVPRRPKSAWTLTNRERFARLVADGRVTGAGHTKGPPPIASDEEDRQRTARAASRREPDIPAELSRALARNQRAHRAWGELSRGQRVLFVRWINDAKKGDTKARRVAEALGKLERGETLGMK